MRRHGLSRISYLAKVTQLVSQAEVNNKGFTCSIACVTLPMGLPGAGKVLSLGQLSSTNIYTNPTTTPTPQPPLSILKRQTADCLCFNIAENEFKEVSLAAK